ncbi:sialoadhesin-like [Paramormyrops kingsleyae]|uniref:sialoadhesin-like n=1 Tax=Paramormyrops kingsleyae TaxID=1676925 RepID=UPI003B976E0C
MTAAERFIFIGCLLQGGLCSTWSVQMPQSIQALNGSCVLIPCTFQIPSAKNQHLINPAGIWWTKRGSSDKKQLENRDIIGKLSEKNCTTVLNRISKTWTGDYSFRIEGNNHIKNNFKEKVKINVEDSPPSPQVTINKDMEVKCTAVYRLQTVKSERTSHTNVTLKVQYSPKNTLVLIGKDGSLTCSSDANPAVNNYTWYKVSGGEIKVVSYTQSLTSNITEVSGQYYCQAQNEHGLQNSSTVQLHCDPVKAPPTWMAAAAGAAGMMLTCILMQILLKKCCPRENHSSKIRVTEELTPINLTSESGFESGKRNICHQLCTKGRDKRSATMKATVVGQQDCHTIFTEL